MSYLVLIMVISGYFQLDWTLMAAIAQVESGLDPTQIGLAGEVGLFQIMPQERFWDRPTAKQLKDPAFSTYYACLLVNRYLAYYGDVEHAIAAYNIGGGRVKRGQPIPPEGQLYVSKVMAARKMLAESYKLRLEIVMGVWRGEPTIPITQTNQLRSSLPAD